MDDINNDDIFEQLSLNQIMSMLDDRENTFTREQLSKIIHGQYTAEDGKPTAVSGQQSDDGGRGIADNDREEEKQREAENRNREDEYRQQDQREAERR